MSENKKAKQQSSSPSGGERGIAIQGYEGSFHQVAAQQFFGKQVTVIPCATFREVVSIAGNKKESFGAMMAIENSIAGSILPNYNLLQKSNLVIIGEVYLQIRQHLLVNPGVQLEDIKEVQSHPMALLQCMSYLEKFPQWKLVETEDTALSAKHIQKSKSKHAASIAGKLAADLFGLEIAAPNVHTLKSNYTRFLALARKEEPGLGDSADKASIYFETDHSKGSLSRVLSLIANSGINLSKLQSMPIPGSEFQYGFYADMEIESKEQVKQVVDEMKLITDHLKVFGVYKKGTFKKQ